MSQTSPYRLTLLVCLAEIFGLASIAVFPALLPTFQTDWRLSHTEAGWISAAYYAGYMILVPVLAGITDRMDARKIMGAARLVGVSTHSIDDARRAVLAGANYIGVGPVFSSTTKSFDSLAGLELVEQVAAEISSLTSGSLDQIDHGEGRRRGEYKTHLVPRQPHNDGFSEP